MTEERTKGIHRRKAGTQIERQKERKKDKTKEIKEEKDYVTKLEEKIMTTI